MQVLVTGQLLNNLLFKIKFTLGLFKINKDVYNIYSFAEFMLFNNSWWPRTTKDVHNLRALSIRHIMLTLKELC